MIRNHKNNEFNFNSFLSGDEEIAELLRLRLQQCKGRCFWAIQDGVSWDLFSQSQDNRQIKEDLLSEIREVAIATKGIQGVVSLYYSSELEGKEVIRLAVTTTSGKTLGLSLGNN